jgi:hypothetical protein
MSCYTFYTNESGNSTDLGILEEGPTLLFYFWRSISENVRILSLLYILVVPLPLDNPDP